MYTTDRRQKNDNLPTPLEKKGSIISVVGKTTMEIMEPF